MDMSEYGFVTRNTFKIKCEWFLQYSGRKLIPERKKPKKMEFMTVVSGKYIDISDLDESSEMLMMPRGMCTAVLPIEQKTPRFLALVVGCRNKEKIKESALPVNSKKKKKKEKKTGLFES